MATKYVRKLLFSIFIVGNGVASLKTDFPPGSIAKENAKKFSNEPRVEQVDFYYRDNTGVLVGVADADGLIELTAGGKPQLAGMDSAGETSQVVQEFIENIVEQAGLARETPCTWVVVPLDELGSGFGALHVGGMGGISGGGPAFTFG